jgi:Spy/CpxP family protein refolding chaperone
MSPRLIRSLAICAVAVGLPLAVLAQVIPNQNNNAPVPAVQGSEHHHGGGAYMRALRSVNLSDGQKLRIASITQSYRQKNQDQNLDQTGRRANMKLMRADILNVLTPAQRTQLQTQMQQMRQQNQQPGQ